MVENPTPELLPAATIAVPKPVRAILLLSFNTVSVPTCKKAFIPRVPHASIPLPSRFTKIELVPTPTALAAVPTKIV